VQPCPLTTKVRSVIYKDQSYSVRDERVENVELSLGSDGVHVVVIYENRCFTDLAFIVPYVENRTNYSDLSDIFVSILELNRAIMRTLDRLI